MTSAWFVGAAGSVPQSESEVRTTIEPIRQDDSTVEMKDSPEFNEFDSDQSGELTGLAPREVIGPTEDIEQYRPWWVGLSQINHNKIVDDQVSSSGTAAAREDRGVQGHGTMQFTESLEPVIRDGSAFGNEYFSPAPMNVQEGAGMYMTPPDQDNWGAAVAQSRANSHSRTAFNASLYSAFMNG